ncbi:DUF1835 domain-containing protein [Lysinibacillus sp. SGAir0095]|uniref:DUF1835 domain-containing protein n=1 Tax=Lysinibacillus sp. SGAir0095 TaxID=2070463 RepID=UPI0010CCDF82|nr:DUF1835 domain-containing protein [Lysinibacillus sp. SGAir0095]QCR32331.1 hypothetical protein C1N55_09155 [Lysinibacillus sp. SGAir0095]
MIHLVIGTTATNSLKLSFRKKNHQIIGFPIDFSVGPLTDLHNTGGINDHFSWLSHSFKTSRRNIEEDKRNYQQALQKLFEIEDGEQVTIWTCENATEQVALRLFSYVLKEKQVELFLVNTFKAMHEYYKDKNCRVDIRHTGECNTDILKHFYENSRYPISDEIKGKYEQEGEELLNSRSYFRTWRQGKIVEEPESGEDSFILGCARRLHKERGNLGFIEAIRLVGLVLGESAHTLSDAWIEYRVRSLIHSGKLVYEGNLKSMSTYKIKVAESLKRG